MKSLKTFVKKLLYDEKSRQMKKYKREITCHMKHLKTKRKLSPEQKEEIQSFYKNIIGQEIDLYSHEYFYSRTGIYSKEYIPTNLHAVELLCKANDHRRTAAFGDKNMADILLKGVKMPHTLLKRMNGYYYYEGRPVSEEEAISLCQNMTDVLFKPVNLSKGKGIKNFTVINGRTEKEGKSVSDLFHEYGDNFQIQERVQQHERMSALNPTSVNTLRIVTYRSGMDILLIYAVVRIGKLGSVVDNQCAGGISAIIDEKGCLGKYAFGGYEEDNIEKTDTGVVINGYQLPSYEKAIEAVKKLHYQLPYFNLIGWDICIDKEGDPVLLEFNTRPGLSQSAFGPGFGKYTERVLRELWPKKNTRY